MVSWNSRPGLVPAANPATSFPGGLTNLFVFNDSQALNRRSAVEMVQVLSNGAPGTTLTAVNATTGRPTVIPRPGGGGWLSLSGVNQCTQVTTQLDPGIVAISTPSEYEVLLLIRQHNDNTGDIFMNSGGGTDVGFRLQKVGTAGRYNWRVDNGAGAVTNLALPAGPTRAQQRRWHVISCRSDGANAQLEQLDGLGNVVATISAALAFTPAGAVTQKATIGSTYALTPKLDVQLGGIAMWARKLSTTERTKAVAALFASANLPTSDMRSVAIFGDSIMAAAVEPAIWQILQGMRPDIRVSQRAVSGTTTSQIATTLTDELTVETPSTVVIQGGVNDINTSVANATILANLDAMCIAAKAAGSRVILLNVLPGDIGGKMVTNTPIVNAGIAGLTHADVLLDINSLVADLHQDQVHYLAAYDFDTLHPSALGNHAIARALADVV